MKPFMGKLIYENQSVFVTERQIHDNIMVEKKVIHHQKLKMKGERYEMALKLDMNKAYDRVEWDFLEIVLGKLVLDKI